MKLANLDYVHVDAILEPALYTNFSLRFRIHNKVTQRPGTLTGFINLDIVTAHLPLTHLSVFCESPVFKAIASFPLHAIVGVLELIPELHSDLVLRKGE